MFLKISLLVTVIFTLASWEHVLAKPLPPNLKNILDTRSAETCGDPSTALNIQEWYSPSSKAHIIDGRVALISSNTGGSDFQFQGDVFRAWDTQVTGTVPLFRLFNPSNADFMFLIPNSDGSLPSVPGYTIQAADTFIYPTQICGSVPLLSVFDASIGDHWYTLDSHERDILVRNGLTDTGIVGFVLPLDTCSCTA